jgi:hypothetical protein
VETTRLSKINNRSKTLRSAIPKKLSDALKLEEKDLLEWRLDVKKGELRARKVELSNWSG